MDTEKKSQSKKGERKSIIPKWKSKIDGCEAAKRGDREKVLEWMQEGGDPNKPDKNGDYVLIEAARKGHSDVVATLLDAKAQVDIQDKLGWTALRLAAYNGLTAMTTILVAKKADVNLRSSLGRSPLMWAAQGQRADTVKTLLDLKANPDFQDKDGETALHEAVSNASIPVVKILLEARASTRLRNDFGDNPMSLAERTHPEIARIIKEHIGQHAGRARHEESENTEESNESSSMFPNYYNHYNSISRYRPSRSPSRSEQSKDTRGDSRHNSATAQDKPNRMALLFAAQEPEDPKPDTTDGHKHIVYTQLRQGQKLGVGNLGIVYAGNWMGTPVAVKSLRLTKEQLHDDDIKQFYADAEKLESFSHPNLATVMGVTSDPIALVTQLYDTSVAALLTKTAVSEGNAKIIALGVAKALQFLHTQEPPHPHAAVKPTNVLVSYSKKDENTIAQVALCDAGFVKLRALASSVIRETGAPYWLAPELMEDEGNTIGSLPGDIYAFGVLLYFLLTGKSPFANMSSVQLLKKVAIGGYRPDFPPELFNEKQVKLISKCWDQDPAKRPSAAETVQELEAW